MKWWNSTSTITIKITPEKVTPPSTPSTPRMMTMIEKYLYLNLNRKFQEHL